jgi:hypothetical protein
MEKRIKHHSVLLNIISDFVRRKSGKIISRIPSFNELEAEIWQENNRFVITFNIDIFTSHSKKIDVGKTYKRYIFKTSESEYTIEDMYVNRYSPPKFTAVIDKIHTRGFSNHVKYYYKLVIPLAKEVDFHNILETGRFSTDLGYMSTAIINVRIESEDISVSCVHDHENKYYLVIDSTNKLLFQKFSDYAATLRVGIGYMLGYYVGDQGYFFAYTSKLRKEPKHFRWMHLRSSILSSYHPIFANSYAYLHKNTKLSNKYNGILRPLSMREFSVLCGKIHESTDFSATLILILESSVASLVFMPGGFAIALETMSDLIINDKKISLSPIKNKEIAKDIRKRFFAILDEYLSEIPEEGMEVLKKKVEQINQVTNKSRLKMPFEILEVKLLDKDLEVLNTRNDFLHGRVPDLTNAGSNRSSQRINKDLYYASLRLYSLLNLLILKWIGYNNRIVNYPKIHESYTGIKIKEEPFRLV